MRPISIEEGDWGGPDTAYRFKITFDAICPENQHRFVKTEDEAHVLFAMMRLGFKEEQIDEMLRPEPMKNNQSPYGFMAFMDPDDWWK